MNVNALHVYKFVAIEWWTTWLWKDLNIALMPLVGAIFCLEIFWAFCWSNLQFFARGVQLSPTAVVALQLQSCLARLMPGLGRPARLDIYMQERCFIAVVGGIVPMELDLKDEVQGGHGTWNPCNLLPCPFFWRNCDDGISPPLLVLIGTIWWCDQGHHACVLRRHSCLVAHIGEAVVVAVAIEAWLGPRSFPNDGNVMGIIINQHNWFKQ